MARQARLVRAQAQSEGQASNGGFSGWEREENERNERRNGLGLAAGQPQRSLRRVACSGLWPNGLRGSPGLRQRARLGEGGTREDGSKCGCSEALADLLGPGEQAGTGSRLVGTLARWLGRRAGVAGWMWVNKPRLTRLGLPRSARPFTLRAPPRSPSALSMHEELQVQLRCKEQDGVAVVG